MFLSRKKHMVQELVYEYLDIASKCVKTCRETFEFYLQTCTASDEFFDRASKSHSFESLGDDKRKAIEFMMYKKCLIPESRGDILGLLETVDRVPNKSESVLKEIYRTNLSIPSEFKDEIAEMYRVNTKAAKLAIKIFYKYFEDPSLIAELHKEIDELESTSDRMHLKIARRVFMSTLPDLQKYLVSQLLIKITQISDHAENLADRVKLLSVKTVF